MNRYDARKLRQWVDKTTGASSLVPAKSVPKTRAQQRLESLEKELDKYDLVEQGAYTKDPETGLIVPSVSIPDSIGYNVSYTLSAPPLYSGKKINFYSYPLGESETDEETAERARKEQEEKQAKLKAFSDKIESVGQQPSAVLEPQAPAEKRVPDYISCLTGWRGWRIKNGRLSALGKNDNWVPKMAVPGRL